MTSKHFEISHEDYAAMQEEIERLRALTKKQREALELCRELAEAAHCFFNHDHGDISKPEILAMYNADEMRFDRALAEYAKARKAVEECLK